MARILSDLVVKKVGSRKWELYTEFVYHVGDPTSDEVIRVPKGFVTDFASVPQPFWWILPPDGRYSGAAVLHDYCYAKHLYPRKRCDEIFLEAMEVLGVSWFKRKTMYRGVRAFGWIAY